MDSDLSVVRSVVAHLFKLGIVTIDERLGAEELASELGRANITIALVGGTTSARNNGRRGGVIEVRQSGVLVLTLGWRESTTGPGPIVRDS